MISSKVVLVSSFSFISSFIVLISFVSLFSSFFALFFRCVLEVKCSSNFFDELNFLEHISQNKFCDLNKNNLLCLENEKLEKDDLFGVEMAHFRIVSIIQENKKLLNYKDK